jgi:hypothetical protein
MKQALIHNLVLVVYIVAALALDALIFGAPQ